MKSNLRLVVIIGVFVAAGYVCWKVLGPAPPHAGMQAQRHAESSGTKSTHPQLAAESVQRSTSVDRAAVETMKTPERESRPTRSGSGSVTGKVVYRANGNPVVGATVRLELRPEGPRDGPPENRPHWEVTTDQQGEFAISRLPDGDYSILAVKDNLAGYASTSLSDAWGNVEEVSVALRSAGTLSGWVRDESGTPIKKAMVFAVPLRLRGRSRRGKGRDILGPSAAHVKSNGQGAFKIGPLPQGRWMLAVKADGFATLESDPVSIGSSGIVLSLEKGVTLHCAVTLSKTGQPAPKVAVVLQSSADGAEERVRPTDENGSVVFTGLSNADYSLSVRDDQYVLSGQPVTFTVRNGVEPKLQRLVVSVGGSITGHVVDAGSKKPIPGVKVAADLQPYDTGFMPDFGSPHAGTSGADGAYTIHGLSAARYLLTCGNAPGYAPQGDSEQKVVAVSLGQTVSGMDIALKRGVDIEGVVVDTSGQPVRNVTVSGDDESTDSSNAQRAVLTTASGTFKLNGFAPFSHITITAQKDGYAQEATPPVALTDQPATGVRIVLGPGGSISGVVVDAAGAPLPDTRVMAKSSDSRYPSFRRGTTTTDADGKFALDGLPAGTYTLHTRMDMNDTHEPVPVAKGQQVTGVRLVVSAQDQVDTSNAAGTLTISGRVTNREGDPVRGADVSATGQDIPFSFGYAITGKDGTYTVTGLATGAHTVSVHSDRYSTPDPVEVPAGSTGVDFTLDAAAKVQGQVVDAATGRPITSFQIAQQKPSNDSNSVESIFSSIPSFALNGDHQFVSFSDPQGRFHLDHVDASSSVLVAHASGYSPTTYPLSDLTPGETKLGVLIRMGAGGSVSGFVKDTAGNPVAGAAVYQATSQQTLDEGVISGPDATTDQSGAFHLNSLPPGPLYLKATHRDFSAAETSVITQAGQVTPVQIVLNKGGVISGVVRRSGKPAPGLDVSAFTMVETHPGDMHDTTTDSNGNYTIRGVAPGEVTVSVSLQSSFSTEMGAEASMGMGSPMSFRTKSQTVMVEAGQVTTANFDLSDSTGVVEGTITSNGQPVRMAMVSVLPSGSDNTTPDNPGLDLMQAGSMTGADGHYRLEGLATGTVNLMVVVLGETGTNSAPDDTAGGGQSLTTVMSAMNTRTVSVPVVDGQTTHQDIELSGGQQVSGVVAGLGAGETAAVFALRGDVTMTGASVGTMMAQMGKYAAMTAANSDGAFTLKGLKPGRYTIVATTFNPQNPSSVTPRFVKQPLTVSSAGAARIELKLP